MQITDQQFIDALRSAAADHPDRRAPGTYWANGAPSCIVGEAMYRIDQSLCPHDNRNLAVALTAMHGCSGRVQFAAAVAQAFNDQNERWEFVGKVFDYALSIFQPGALWSRMEDSVREFAMREKSLAYTPSPYVNKGGVVKGGITFNNVNFTKVNSDIAAMNASMDALVKSMSNASLSINLNAPAQKDHALVA